MREREGMSNTYTGTDQRKRQLRNFPIKHCVQYSTSQNMYCYNIQNLHQKQLIQVHVQQEKLNMKFNR